VFRALHRQTADLVSTPRTDKKIATRVESSIWQEFCFYNQYPNRTVNRV